MSTSHIREGFHTATPYLVVNDGAAALEFYKRAFDAVELLRHTDDAGIIRHAELRIGDSPVMLAGESPEYPDWRGPISLGGTPAHIYLYVEDADALFTQAIAAGATEMLPMETKPYGDRMGGIVDPYGHIWYVASHVGAAASSNQKIDVDEEIIDIP